MKSRATQVATLWVYLVYFFMYLPVAMIAIFSFNASEIIAFPLQGFTFQWYQDTFTDLRLLGGLKLTFLVAIPTALFSTILGAMAALALTRFPIRRRMLLLVLILLPFLIPKMILAVAQLILLSDLGIARTIWTIIAGQTIIILPFTTLVNASVLMRIDKRLEEAAFDLGASHFSAFRRVTLPLMKNGLMAAWFIAFVLSSAEYVLTSFLSGRAQPLSILVASDFRFNISPALDAIALMLVVANIALIGIGEFIRLRSQK
ncbi:ABC transporter permease [Martelella alba]|uniref:ABC transporter permease n=1 Tax=Martelella alba TaxID=2590451 RepID=A0A506UF28_9HYPH|nr:ABC transporter permease [Martelella alba]TPW31604.1 ABC transporter permease [Martelella alba]